MNFMIEIRHIESGLAKVFHTVEEMAAHLAEHVKDEWEGWQHLRLHPALVALDAPKVEAEPAEPDAGAPAPSGLMETAAVPEHWDAQGEPLPGNPLLAEAPAQPAADAPAHDPAQDTTGS